MRKLACVLLLAALAVGCTTRTEYGKCIGLVDDGQPGLHYKLSAWNLALAVVFSETIVVPIVVAVDDAKCPMGKKASV
jgi:hypothetical protein